MRTTEAIFMWDGSGLGVLVPKKRGDGFLRVPYGHHSIEKLNDIVANERCDMDGLDGYLCLTYGYVELSKRAEIIARMLPQLAAFYGFKTWREDRRAFWKVLQPNL